LEGAVQPGILIKNLQRADLSFCDEAETFLQSGFWGSFKARFGWDALAFRVEWAAGGENAGDEVKSLLVLRRILAPGLSLAYVPWGPELPASCPDRAAALVVLTAALKAELPKNTAFIRFDLPWYTENIDAHFILPAPFLRSGVDIQAPDTVIVDLTQPMESLLEQMKPKWRYNARLAKKRGVVVNQADGKKITIFYELLNETAIRDGIAIHSPDYYKTLFESGWYSGKKPDLRLYLAEHGGDVLAGIVTLFRGREAVYLYGASSNKKRNFMATYLLQLKAMEDAKASGCEEYDLYGIPPNEDQAHHLAGLYRFKTGFGGRMIHRSGCWDYPYRPVIYRLLRSAETVRKSIMQIGRQNKHYV
jgi:lipid II:glycine glycyltransferase (peptidoglycan interpeptide bridge formation enzyme)